MSFDAHAGEPPKSNPVNSNTEVMLDDIKRTQGQPALVSLSGALGKLATSLAISITREGEQVAKLALSKSMASSMIATLPVKSIDIGSTIASINSTLGKNATADTAKVHQAAQSTDATPDPAAIGNFTDKMADSTAMESKFKMESMSQSLGDVNGMKAAVDRRI